MGTWHFFFFCMNIILELQWLYRYLSNLSLTKRHISLFSIPQLSPFKSQSVPLAVVCIILAKLFHPKAFRFIYNLNSLSYPLYVKFPLWQVFNKTIDMTVKVTVFTTGELNDFNSIISKEKSATKSSSDMGIYNKVKTLAVITLNAHCILLTKYPTCSFGVASKRL